IVLSCAAENMRFPSGLNATLTTEAVCPSNRRVSFPFCQFHRPIVLSALPEAICCPSGEKATVNTACVCPSSLHNSLPVSTSQTRTVFSEGKTESSPLPVARYRPSGEKARQLTSLACPTKRRISFSGFSSARALQSRPSAPAASRKKGAKEQRTAHTPSSQPS